MRKLNDEQLRNAQGRWYVRNRHRRFGGSSLKATNFMRWLKLAWFVQKMDGVRGSLHSLPVCAAIYELRFGCPPKEGAAETLFCFLPAREDVRH